MKKFIISASALLLIFFILAVFFLFSNRGLQFSVQLVSYITEDRISIDSTAGRLIGPLKLEGIHFHSPRTNLFIKKLAVNWRPMGLLQKQLHIPELLVDGVEVTMVEQELDDPDAKETQLPNKAVVIPFLVENAVLKDIAISSSVGEKELFIEQISSSLSGGREGISINDMSVQASGYRIDSQTHLEMSEAWTILSRGTWQVVRTGCSQLEGAFVVSGPLDNPQISLSMIKPETIDIQGSLSRISGEVNWSIKGSGHDIFLPDICFDWPDLKSNLVFHTEGTFDDYRVNLDTGISPSGLPPLSVELDMSGNNDGLVIAESPVNFDGSRSLLTGQVDWGEIVSWSATISISAFDFSPYQDYLAGHADLELDITGTIDESALAYEAQISQLRLSVDEFSVDVTGAVRLRGDLQGAEVLEARIATGKEMVELSGRLGWTDGLAWDVLMQLDGIDPATWSDLPHGGLSAAVASRGHVDGEETELKASMTSLSGELAGYSVKGGGEIDYYPGQLEIKDFFLITGRNSMEVNGTVGDNVDLTLMVDGRDLGQIFEPLAGQLEIAASIAGTKEKPVINFSAGAVDIAYLDYALNELHANGSVDKEGGIDLRLAVEHFSKDDSTIGALNLSIIGTLENHTIIAGASSDFGDLNSSMTGQLLDYRSWEGSIDDLNYVHQDYGRWQQEKKSTVTVSPDLISFDDLCITSPGNRVCAGASWSSAGSWQAELSELQLEMSKLKDWNIIEIELAGDVLGSFVLDGVGPVVNNGRGTLTVSKLHAPLPENDVKEEIELTDTQLTFNLHDQILTAALSSSSVNGSVIDMGLTVDQFGDLSLPMLELPLEGSVRVDIVDVGLLKQLSGDMLVPSGQLSSDFTISGTIQRPFFDGKVTLEDGEILIPDLGLLLSNIALGVEGDTNVVSIDLLAHSGDGQVRGTGTVFLDGDDWQGELSIRGDNLQVIEQREMRVSISPDLDLRADSNGVTLTGKIEIPRARIEPEKMIVSDTTSRDTVFTDDIGSRDGIPFQFDIAVILGDDITVEGYGFSGFFVGNLDISGADNREIRGMGEIQVGDGSFSVGERVLDISRGRMVFAGGPVDNPVLDIQARKTTKRVPPGTTDVIVGVNITGTAQDYFIELFSDPPMDDRDILSYIVQGRPFSSEDGSTEGILNSAAMLLGINRANRLLESFGGRGLIDRVSLDKDSESSDVSLVVDRRLTDRVIIGYDFNLFDNAGQFRFHYKLREGFLLEVRNSVDSTGVELLYSVER
jgi:translocation and assembly module TamB